MAFIKTWKVLAEVLKGIENKKERGKEEAENVRGSSYYSWIFLDLKGVISWTSGPHHL